MLIGYARVSTDAQDTAAQVAALQQAGCRDIFQENVSGAKADRKRLKQALAALEPDDVLVVTKIDRLARNVRDLHNIVAQVIERGAQFRALDQPAMNTADTYGRFLLGILANVAELERDLILSRTKEGRKRFLANGGKLGRKAKLSPTQIKTARTMRELGSSYAEIGAVLGVAHTTVSRAIGD